MCKPLFSEKLKNTLVQIFEKNQNSCLKKLFVIESMRNLNQVSEKVLEKSISMLDYVNDSTGLQISYLPIGREPIFTETGKWSRSNRQRGKIGKTIMTLIKQYEKELDITLPTDKEVEEFVNLFKSHLSYGNFEFKLVKGSDIKKYYHYSSYYEFPNGGYTLQNSCMRYSSCHDFFKIYEQNENCELLIMFDKSLSSTEIVARALVWTFNGVKYVDRRYFAMDTYQVAMIDYIEENKWAYKAINSYEEGYALDFYVFCKEKDEYELKEVNITFCLDFEVSKFPYMDTLKFYDFYHKILTNTSSDDYNYVILNSTDGGYEGDDREECFGCCRYFDIDDMYYSDYSERYICQCCGEQDAFDNYHLSSELITAISGNGVLVKLHEDSINDYAAFSESRGQWFILPGNSLEEYYDLVEFDEDSFTEEEFEIFKEAHELLTDTIAIKL